MPLGSSSVRDQKSMWSGKWKRMRLERPRNPNLAIDMKKLAILLFVLAAVSATPMAKAAGISIEVGDRPYYEGREFWDWGWHYVWVPGHWNWSHSHWIRGYYIRQGEWSSRHGHHRHHWQQHHEH